MRESSNISIGAGSASRDGGPAVPNWSATADPCISLLPSGFEERYMNKQWQFGKQHGHLTIWQTLNAVHQAVIESLTRDKILNGSMMRAGIKCAVHNARLKAIC